MDSKVKLTVELTGRSPAHPQLVITTKEPLYGRELDALAHDYAAKVLRATPPLERWLVSPSAQGERTALVEIELWDGDAREEEAAMTMLEALAK